MADNENNPAEVAAKNEEQMEDNDKGSEAEDDDHKKSSEVQKSDSPAKKSPKKEVQKSTDAGVRSETPNNTSGKDNKDGENGKNDGDDDEDEDDEDEDDSDEEELPPGLLEQPLEVSGKREKKKVERLSATMPAQPEKKKVEIGEGSGMKLGDIEYIEHQITTTKAVDLKTLHHLLYGIKGTKFELKRNIRQFCGFTHEPDSKEYEKKMAFLNKLFLNDLKSVSMTLGVERSGTKKEIVERIMEFLMKPDDRGVVVRSVKRKRSSKSSSAKKGTKRKSASGKKTKKKPEKKKSKKQASDDEDNDDEEEEEEDDEEDAEENGRDEDEDEEEEDIESEDEEPKKKKQKKETKKKADNKKKTPAKKESKQNGKKEKSSPKQTKKASPKKKPAAISSDDMSEDSDDEPIARKIKTAPSNDEIKTLVKKILDGADLEQVTMKTVVKQVYAKYPTFDLSDRKDFIKDTVREVIS